MGGRTPRKTGKRIPSFTLRITDHLGLRGESPIRFAGRNHLFMRTFLLPGSGDRDLANLYRTMAKCKANAESAVQNAIEHKAEGILLTSWGDCGNHQPWTVLYPPLVYAAQLAWNGKQLEDGQVSDATNRLVFGCGTGKSGGNHS